jgi:AbrB family looped-hinge helix DNA binding protein
MVEFIRGRVTDAGRVVIPAELRRDFHIEDGQEIVFCRDGESIQLLTAEHVIKKSQDAVRRYIGGDDIDLTDELLKARKLDGSLG